MKKRFLPFGILLAAAGVAVTFLGAPEATYTPIEDRGVAAEEVKKGWKGAFEHMMKIKANPETGKVDPSDVLNAREQVRAHRAARSSNAGLDLQWQEMGPDNAGGRTRAILIDKDDHNKMFAGGVTGGMWRSDDAGLNWSIVPGSDAYDNIGVVCITQAANGDIYFGTGEEMFSNVSGNAGGSSGSIGGGIYKSTDGGVTFEALSSTVPTANDITNEWATVGEMASDPTNENRIYAATGGGLKISSDGGQSWENSGVSGSAAFMDVEVASDGSVIASTNSKIYYSDSGDAGTFSQLQTISVLGAGNGRIELEVAPSDPNYIYAIYSNAGGLGKFKGFYRSVDKGQSWEELLPGWVGTTPPVYNIFNQQANYDMALAVDPNDKDHVILGGLDIWEWSLTTGIEKKSYWASWEAASYYVHADQHEILYHPTIPGKIYIGNDGGVFVTEDNTTSFSGLNRGYGVTQFYAIGFSKEGYVVGGTQDNGTHVIDLSNPASDLSSVEIKGGDGGYAEISYFDSNIIFAESQNGSAGRSADGGSSMSSAEGFFGDTLGNLYVKAFEDFDNPDLFAGFINPFLLWESVDQDGLPKDTSFFFAAASSIESETSSEYCVWMTKEALDFSNVPQWYQVSTSLSGEPRHMAVTSDGNSLFVAANNGWSGTKIYRLDNLNLDTVPDDFAHLDVDGYLSVVTTTEIYTTSSIITGLASDPNNPNRLVVTMGGYHNGNHVYEFTDALSEVPSDPISIQGNLPKMPVYSAVIDVNNSDNILVGTEFGVWSTSNGATWTQENNGMPNVPCYMLRQQTLPGVNKGTIYVGTHGRGIFKSASLVGLEEFAVNTNDFTELMIYPSPAINHITVEVDGVESYTTQIFDMMGREVYSTDEKGSLDVSMLEPGNYVVLVKSLKGEQVGKFVKTK